VIGANRTLAELRAIQDWFVRYQLTKAGGVAEVASVGGFVKQYQVVVDPAKLRGYGIALSQVTDAIRKSNMDVGGRVIQGKGIGYLAQHYGWNHALWALLGCIFIGIFLLSFTWNVRPRS